jgi:hypothetical protein
LRTTLMRNFRVFVCDAFFGVVGRQNGH